MKLRTELSLFFGGLLVVVLVMLVTANYSSLTRVLEESLTRDFTPQPYLQVFKSDAKLLAERATALESSKVQQSRKGILETFRAIDSSMKSLGAEVQGDFIGRSLAAPETEQERTLEGEIYSLGDRVIELYRNVQPPLDLIAIINRDGWTVLEFLDGVTSEQFAEPEFRLKFQVPGLRDTDLWRMFTETSSNRGFFVYPNGKLYLYGSFLKFKGNFSSGTDQLELLLLLGDEVNRSFLQDTVGDIRAFVAFGDNVVGTDDDTLRLGRLLLETEQGAVPEIWHTGQGQTFLVKSAPLLSTYDELSPVEGEEVARLYLLREYSQIEAAARAQAQRSLILGFAALAIALLVVPVMARRFTAPIETLSEAMKSVGEGRLEPIPEEKIAPVQEVRDASLSYNTMIIGLRQKKALEAFVPEGTRQEVELARGEMPELGGVRLERTIMFSDLRGFTSMSEKLPATQVMSIINIYLDAMSREIRSEGGDINEYIGDAILAVFADPDAAVRAAKKMNLALTRLHQDATTEELRGLKQGIGIHTGDIVEGNIGEAGTRLKRAVVGDTVNLAARIQDRSRAGQYTQIFLSQDTRERLEKEYDLELFGEEEFKGKAAPVPVWEVRTL